jgi:hypothetical protein
MPITYTNRKGWKYFLCQGVTKTGKPRYYFSRDQKSEPLEEIPEGYEITESVNGIVSLSKVRPKLLLKQEIAIVKSAMQKHPQAKNYRIDTKSKEIKIYEQAGLDLLEIAEMLAAEFGFPGVVPKDFNRAMKVNHNIYPQFTPIMKFTLTDKKKRLFRAQRMSYLGNVDDWIDIEYDKTIEELASTLIPTLGTDEFFELY